MELRVPFSQHKKLYRLKDICRLTNQSRYQITKAIRLGWLRAYKRPGKQYRGKSYYIPDTEYLRYLGILHNVEKVVWDPKK